MDPNEEMEEVLSLGDEDAPQLVEDVGIELDDMDLQQEEEEEEGSEGVVFFDPLRDDSVSCFDQHKGPVFTVDVNSSSSLIVSGSQDDRAIVWRASDGEIAFECTGHKDSVTCASFSHDDKYVATSDLSGLVQVWDCTKGTAVWSFETSPIEWLLWHSQAHVLLAGTSDGEGWVWRIPSGDCKTIPSHGVGNMAAILLPDGKSSCFGYSDGSLKVWDLRTSSLLQTYSPPSSEESPVTCVSIHPKGTYILSGHIDGSTKLFNTLSLKLLVSFSTQTSQTGGEENDNISIETVGFLPSHNLVLVGSVTGRLSVWDLSTQKLRHVCQPDNDQAGIARMYISKALPPLVYTCHIDGIIRAWNILTAQCVQEWHGHCASILDIKLIKDETIILTCSDDWTVRLFQTTPKTAN